MTETIKNNQQALMYGLVLIALVIVYFKRDTIKDFFSKSGKSTSSTATSTGNNTPSIVSNANTETVLRNGSTGKQVLRLQELLNSKNSKSQPTFLLPLAEDSNFGKKTETMLKKYTGKTSISITQLIKALI